MREFVLNYRHPSPRRGWKGGSDRPLRDHIVKIRGIRGIWGIRGCVPKWGFTEAKPYFLPQEGLQEAPEAERGSGKPWVSSGSPRESFGKVWVALGHPSGAQSCAILRICAILSICVIVGGVFKTEIPRVHRNPTTSQKSYDFTEILRLQRKPMTSQKSYDFTEILRLHSFLVFH